MRARRLRADLRDRGPIKALALQHNGFNAIGLGGVSTTLTKNNHELNDTWKVVALHRREVVIVFDAGRVSKPDVARAEARLALALEQRHAEVKVVALPLREGGDDQGPDDFIATHGSGSCASWSPRRCLPIQSSG